MLILRTLILEPMHGYGIGTRLTQISNGVLQVNGGSLFPALGRLERNGVIKGEWRSSENGRKANYYSITAQGRVKLKRETRDWETQSDAIARVLRASLGEL
ncbi:MAG: PadR family transcriptional regulator [Cyanobacteria bacterium]|nr:PadR family transcriptional regulator [Cyanobacteriota bacterium]